MPILRGILAPLAALILSLSFGQAPKPQPQGAAPPAVTTSAILLGQVVDADTGDPVDDAFVTLTGRPAPPRARGAGSGSSASLFDLMMVARGGSTAERVAAGSNGRVVFRGLPVSNYFVRAEAPGYVSRASDLGGAGGSASVQITEGQTSARVTLRLWKQAVLTGVVLDEAGEPVIGASVRAFRRAVSRFGTLSYDPDGPATTDDRGIYRLSGLEPGSYLVLVPQSQSTAPAAAADAFMQGLLSGQMPEGGLGALGGGAGASPMDPRGVRVGEWRVTPGNVPPAATGTGQLLSYRTMFFPTATSPTDATWITLRSGEERGGVDFTLQPVATGTVTGIVSGPAGSPGGVPIRLVPAGERLVGDPAALDVATGQTQADGRFTLLAVPPGQYRVIARREAPRNLAADLPAELESNPMVQFAINLQRGQARTPLFGEAPVTVAPGATVDVTIAASEGVNLAGRLEFQDGAAPARNEITRAFIALRPLDISLTGARTVRPAADATFTAAGVLPGRYGVTANMTSPGAPWLVKHVAAGGRDLTRTALVVEDRAVTDVVVTLTRETGTLKGSVRRDAAGARDARTGAPRQLTALAVPANFLDWTDFELLVDRVQLASVADDGSFRLGPVLPGEYLIVVADEMQVDPGGGLAMLRSLALQATRVRIGPGDANAVTVGVARVTR